MVKMSLNNIQKNWFMRQFYELFSSIKWNPLGSKLSWSHYRKLLILNDTNEIMVLY